MDPQTAVVVAAIAAIASIIAAVLAFHSSRTATRGARKIGDINHRVAQVDREAEQLRTDFAAFVTASGETGDRRGQSRMLAADVVLGANPRCSESLRDAASKYTTAITNALNTLGGSPGQMRVGTHLEALRVGFAESMALIATERATILESDD